MTIDTLPPAQSKRIRIQSKRVRMARAALDVSLKDFAERVSAEYESPVSGEMMRRIEQGGRDVEYGLLRAIAQVVREAISDETATPVEWLGGGGEPVFVNPGSLKRRWLDYIIPGPELVAIPA